jgi:hypothetical protein
VGVSRQDAKFAKGLARGGSHGMTRKITERGGRTMARGGWTTKDTKHTKGEMAKPPIGKALA